MSSEQSINFWNLTAHFSTTAAVLVNGCYCCHTMLLPNGNCFKKIKHHTRPLTEDIGMSLRSQCGCIGCSFCLKLNSEQFKCNICEGEHACSAPCCKCGKAEMNLSEAQCCWVEAQLCCCVHRCLPSQCAPYNNDTSLAQQLPESLGIAFLGYQKAPNSGVFFFSSLFFLLHHT
jgi:hypothetical protein